jgi:hypothetical protein
VLLPVIDPCLQSADNCLLFVGKVACFLWIGLML